MKIGYQDSWQTLIESMDHPDDSIHSKKLKIKEQVLVEVSSRGVRFGDNVARVRRGRHGNYMTKDEITGKNTHLSQWTMQSCRWPLG